MRSSGITAPEPGASSEPGCRVQSHTAHLGMLVEVPDCHMEPQRPPPPRTGSGEEVGGFFLAMEVLACLVSLGKCEHPQPAPMSPENPSPCSCCRASVRGLDPGSMSCEHWKGTWRRWEMVFS